MTICLHKKVLSLNAGYSSCVFVLWQLVTDLRPDRHAGEVQLLQVFADTETEHHLVPNIKLIPQPALIHPRKVSLPCSTKFIT